MTAIPMPELFDHCVRRLRAGVAPVHYADLTESVLRIDMRLNPSSSELFRAKEDVREKLLLARNRGTAYTGAPHFAAVMQDWFPGDSRLLNCDEYAIPGDIEVAIRAAADALKRARYMQTKVADCEARWDGCARGKVIEGHVVEWFEKRYPRWFLPAVNARRYSQWCDHDFRIVISGRTLAVDVMGPGRRGEFSSGHKRKTDIHIPTTIRCNSVRMRGFIQGARMLPEFDPVQLLPISWLLVRLSCQNEDIDYDNLARVVRGERKAA